MAEFQALILGLGMAMETKRRKVKVFGDSKLIINQLLSLYEVKKLELITYYCYTTGLLGWFQDITIEHIPRKENKQVDILEKLASTLVLPNKEAKILICQHQVVPTIFEDESNKEEVNPMYIRLVEYVFKVSQTIGAHYNLFTLF